MLQGVAAHEVAELENLPVERLEGFGENIEPHRDQ